jgi:hypothetical protein
MMNWSYAAAAWDGEGSMGLTGDARRPGSILPYMQLTQSNKYRGFRMIEELSNFLRTHDIQTHIDVVDDRGRITGGGKRNYETSRITIRSYHNIVTMLRHIIPYMITRKQTAQDLLRFLVLFPPRTGAYAQEYRDAAWPLSNLAGQGERAYKEPYREADKPYKPNPWHVPILSDAQVARIRAIGSNRRPTKRLTN